VRSVIVDTIYGHTVESGDAESVKVLQSALGFSQPLRPSLPALPRPVDHPDCA